MGSVNLFQNSSTGTLVTRMPIKSMIPTGADGTTGTGTILRGTISFGRDKLKAITPAYTGFTHIFLIKGIRALESYELIDANFKAEAQIHAKHFKFFLEHASLSYDGTPDLQLGMSDVPTGYQDRSIGVPTSATYDSNQFSIQMIETYGEPLRRCFEFIIQLIFDPTGKYVHLFGSSLEPVTENLTFELMVVTTDQTLKRITDITVWEACTATGIDRSNLNWEQGNIETIQPKTVQFRGVPRPNAWDMFDTAKTLMTSRLNLYKSVRNAELELGMVITA